MALQDIIPAGAIIAIDTPPFIYYIEGGTPFDALALELFDECLSSRRNRGFTTVITLAEVLVGSTAAGRLDITRRYRDILRDNEQVDLVELTSDIAERAVDLRVRYGLRLADAFQVAAAIMRGASYFVTNDLGLTRVQEISVIALSEVS